MTISRQRLIKANSFSRKQKDYLKWALEQIFFMTDLGHVLEESFSGKLPRNESMYLNDSTTKHNEWAKYWQQNAKMGAAIMCAMERGDIILALQEANKLELTLPSRNAPNIWKGLKNTFQLDDGLSSEMIR